MNFTLDTAQVVGLVVSVILPLIVALVTSRAIAPKWKAIILAALTVLINVGTEFYQSLTTGAVFDWGTALVSALGAFLISVGMHFGLWKPVGASEALQKVGSKH